MLKKITCLVAGFLLALLHVYAHDTVGLHRHVPATHRHLVALADDITYTTPLQFCEGGNVVLTAPAGTSYQWKKGGVDIAGATSAQFTATETGSYTVLVDGASKGPVSVVVFSRPVPAFSFNNNNACSGTPVQFSSSSTSGTAPFTYNWDFGDGNSSNSANPVHSFQSLGCGTQVFAVKLTVTDANGCTNAITQNITVKQKPDVRIRDQNVFTPFSNCNSSPTPQNPNYSITILNDSPDPSCITSYTVDWGDGTIITNATFPLSHQYTQLGAFTLTVTANGSNGCSNSKTYTVANQSNPAGSLGTLGSTTGHCAPATIPFTISNWQLNSPGTTYRILFGDGTETTLTHPLNPNFTTDTIYHTYTKSSCPTPTFTATLQVINACATTPYTAGNIQINSKPAADFNVPPTACVGQSVCFNNTTVTGFYGIGCSSTTIYSWDFGDGSSSSQSAPCHIYNTPGTYTVTLTTSNPCGTTTVTKQICVVATPTAAFTIDQTSGCGPLTVTATNTSSTLNSCIPTTYQWTVTHAASGCAATGAWSFAIGSNDASISPTFIFSNAGTYTIKLAVTNACGTVNTTKTITVKQPPTVTLSNIPNACGPVSINPVATVSNCGTGSLSYQWTFTGGSPASSTSATPGPVSYTTPGTYTVSVVVTNECGSTTRTQSFTINPLPNITAPANLSICAGTATAAINFGGTPGATYSWSNSNTAIGLGTSGTGSAIPSFTASNSGTSPLVATITLNASAGGCATNVPFTITVQPRPAAPVVTATVAYCENAAATSLDATALAGHTLNWYTTASGGTPSPTTPTPSTALAGNTTYYVSQTNTATGCEGPRASITVTVNASPAISGHSVVHPASCGAANGSISLTGLTAGLSYVVNYTKGGVAQTATITANASGTVVITGLTAATYDNIRVTRSGCVSNAIGPVSLADPNPPATPTASGNTPLCEGATLNLSAGGGAAGVTYAWSGPNGFSSTNQNPVIPSVTIGSSGVYSVTATKDGCTSPASTVTITVNPKPAKPVVTRPYRYCLNDAATPLVGAPSGGNQLNWYDNAALSNGSATPPIPSTATAGTVNFFVTQTNSFGCTSDTSKIAVTVYPPIAGNVIRKDTTICSGNNPGTLTGTQTVTGGDGSYLYSWEQSTNGGTSWAAISGATGASYIPGALTQTTLYRRIVQSGPCAGVASNIVTVTIEGSLTNTNIAAAQTVCAGLAPAQLQGETPAGGSGAFIFQWQQSANNTTWDDITGAVAQDYQPPVLNATTYYRRKVTSGSCAALSNVVTITVNPKPVMQAQAPLVYCSNASVPSLIFNSNLTSGVTYNWTNDNTNTGLAATGTGALPAFTASNTVLPKTVQLSTITVTPTYTQNGVGCAGTPIDFTIAVLPSVSIAPISDTIVCTGTNLPSIVPQHDAVLASGASIAYQWTVSGSGTNLTPGNGPTIPAIITNNSNISDLVTTIVVTPVFTYGGKACTGTPETFTITVKPATPDAAAGPDVQLCAAAAYTMQASGGNGLWTSIGASGAVIVNPSAPNTLINGLQAGNVYQFVWTVSGFASCPPTKDTVTITVVPPLLNEINTTPQTVCYGQPVTITGTQPSGGNGINYQYSWQTSLDNSTWTTLPGATGASLSFVPQSSMWVRRVVVSLPCTAASLPVELIVQPPIGNNTIGSNHAVCINTAAQLLTGAQPTGANGAFLYQWQRSIDAGATWTDIAGATNADYNPGLMTATTGFRRTVSTNLCSGAQNSVSNIVVITVNPDAVASFTASMDTGCAPFVINSTVITAGVYPSNNGDYLWYANGVYIGSGATFPGYTMNAPGDSVIIKLVAVSSFGCRSDSVSRSFYTRIAPVPQFLVSDSAGCGPLTVQFTNASDNLSKFTYHWNFGNGQSYAGVQPPPIVFASNPTYGDTTYNITLSASSSCVTVAIVKPVRVKSKPKALFTPDITTGCSPMQVVFNNTSRGLGNSYVWYFGDGSGPVTTSAAVPVTHTFYSGVRDTFYVKLVAVNECGSDSLSYAIVVAPNAIALDVALNGNQQSGCAPHTVSFINNSSGASAFSWNFGDNNSLSTTRNIDTVTHTYLVPGTYTMTLHATNGCSDTTTTETITVYPKPEASFTASNYLVCRGDSILFTNTSAGATSYLWKFGDGNTSTLTSPRHAYTTPGIYDVTLITYRLNAPGSICTDSSVQPVQVVGSRQGTFTASDTVGYCAPFTITFNNMNMPAVTALWDFGDGSTGSGNTVSHTYLTAGEYIVSLTVTVPGGCVYNSTKLVKVLGPAGSWTHSTGYLCNNAAAFFQVQASNTDSILYDFGDGQGLTTTANTTYHSYANPGVYFPRAILKNNAGCFVPLPGLDSIRVDRIRAGYTTTQQQTCGNTTVHFSDTSRAFFGKVNVAWDFGDGTTGSGFNATHSYAASGTYPVRMIVYGASGCSDTLLRPLTVTVFSKPVAQIVADTVACVGVPISFNSVVTSVDATSLLQWTLSNGVSSGASSFTYRFTAPGLYTVRLVAGTVNGCYDTVSQTVRVNPSPSVFASNDAVLCLGSSMPLQVNGIGAASYSWSPLQGLSCYNCPNPIAQPLITTPYVVQGTNSFGCSAYDTVVITVIQPLHLQVSPSDSICVGQSINLLASGATSYNWSPAAGLNSTTISNPTASPAVTTRYRVVGYDGYNCFTDTAYVLVGVGQYPTISLGPDLTLATGTQHPLNSSVTNGPITNWLWTPSTDLNCSNCPLPVAHIKKDISYAVVATNAYGCSASDTIRIKTFCESAQVFIPNAFTPNNDGYNDRLMVRATGVALVKSFRIFNRWGELVFEVGNCQPNNPQYGWDGRVKGKQVPPDVFVYTAEVLCENGSSYTYKGNVTLLK